MFWSLFFTTLITIIVIVSAGQLIAKVLDKNEEEDV